MYERGWTPVNDINAGEWILTETGDWQAVQEVYATGEWETVYNLRVQDHHTYFVGDDDWGWSAWVHNAYDFMSGLKVIELSEGLGVTISELVRKNILNKIRNEGTNGDVGDMNALSNRIADAIREEKSAGAAVTNYLSLVGVKDSLSRNEREIASAENTGGTQTPDERRVSGWTAYIHKKLKNDALNRTFDDYMDNHHPEEANNPHGHHIIFKDAAAHGAGKADARAARDILLYAGINPYFDRENLAYAPNQGHTESMITTMYNELNTMFASGQKSKSLITAKLKNFAERYIERSL